MKETTGDAQLRGLITTFGMARGLSTLWRYLDGDWENYSWSVNTSLRTHTPIHRKHDRQWSFGESHQQQREEERNRISKHHVTKATGSAYEKIFLWLSSSGALPLFFFFFLCSLGFRVFTIHGKTLQREPPTARWEHRQHYYQTITQKCGAQKEFELKVSLLC